MKSIQQIMLSSLVLFCLNHSAWAVRPAHETEHSGVSSSAKARNLIQRGGKITGIDSSQHTLSVDGISYPLQTGSLTVHPANSQSQISLSQLTTGTMIRFTTTKEGWNGTEVIKEIWVTPPPRPIKK